jgi:hypothetical protein
MILAYDIYFDMVKMNFKEWINKDIFGFEREVLDAQDNSKPQNELPIQGFMLNLVMERLETNNLSLGHPFSRFPNEMQWGTQPGAVRVVWTPKLNVKIQKLHLDLEGNRVWIMKRFYFVNDLEFGGGNEHVVADEIFEEVKIVAKDQLDSSSGQFKLENIVYPLASVLRQQDYQVIELDRIVKISENEYDINFWCRGGGVGKTFGPRGQRPVLAFILKMHYNEHTGLIKTIAEMATAEDDTTKWELQPAEFEELYMPSQPKKEIIDSIVTALKWF